MGTVGGDLLRLARQADADGRTGVRDALLTLAVIGLSKVQVPTLGSIIFWALNYNALLIGQIAWIIAPIVATVTLFLGLFLTSTGYNELFAERRGVA